VFFVAKAPASSKASHQSITSTTDSETLNNPLDQVSSADIAVHVARAVGLQEATSVVNHADSVNADASSVPANESVVAKPQVISTAIPSRKDIRTYTAVAGDTLSSIATKFGVSSDSVRWSNSLTSNTVPAGKQLILPPAGVNGIVYTVKAGDTPESLAQKYSASKDAIISFNDAEVVGIKTGEQILIPDGSVQAPTVSASYSYSGFAWGGASAVYSANGYDYGWCTWWAAKRRADIGHPVPSNLGNASSWRYLAPRAGLAVDGTPTSGAVAWYKNIGGLGHVGFVEQVNEDGSIWISDMNYYGVSAIGGSTPAGGWGRTSYHLVTPGDLGSFLFIH
jgi:surface antigen